MKKAFDLYALAQKKRIVVAHRGATGGNIPCNTAVSYEIALKQGADMIEIDVTKSRDGKLFIFHPGMEPAHLNLDCDIRTMTADEIAQLRYVNPDNVPTQFGLNTLDEIFERFKGRCYINVDKFWDNPKEISEAIHRHGIGEQVLVKSALKPEYREFVLSTLEKYAPDISFMPVVSESFPEHAELMRRPIRYVGAEVLFSSEESEVCSPAFVEKMHRDGKLVWVNSIIYNCKKQLTAGHSDDTALGEDEEKGWGWLADRNFDLIQTDWPQMLIQFLKDTGRYER